MFNTPKAPFNNILARQAFAYAVDRDALQQAAPTTTSTTQADGPFGPGVLGYLADTGLPTYNLAKAEGVGRDSTSSRPARTSRSR